MIFIMFAPAGRHNFKGAVPIALGSHGTGHNQDDTS